MKETVAQKDCQSLWRTDG